jgi:Rieske 2Fe-2S family protein
LIHINLWDTYDGRTSDVPVEANPMTNAIHLPTTAGPAIAGLEPTLETRWYRSEDAFRVEKESIFFREWMCICREEEIAGPGAYRVIDVLGESILLVRNREGALRGFYNVCRHRGARLCRTAAAGGAPSSGSPSGVMAGRGIVCPYHNWTYDLEGRLVAAPHVRGLTASDKAALSLHPVGVDTWGGFVFVNLTPGTARTLIDQLGSIAERTKNYPLRDLRIGRTIQYRVLANWKVICENYNECYHCGPIHPELCAVVPAFREAGGGNLDWMRGIPHRPGAYTFTADGTTSRRPFPGLTQDERERHKGDLSYPNLFLSLSCDHVAAFILQPRSAEQTDIACHFLFEPHELDKPQFDPSDAVEFWDVVNRQDWSICESVQQGMSARVHQFGYYAPMEDSALDIRRYVQERV